jgi:hypothetical protein
LTLSLCLFFFLKKLYFLRLFPVFYIYSSQSLPAGEKEKEKKTLKRKRSDLDEDSTRNSRLTRLTESPVASTSTEPWFAEDDDLEEMGDRRPLMQQQQKGQQKTLVNHFAFATKVGTSATGPRVP